MLWGWNAIISVKNVPQCLAYSKHSTTAMMMMILWSHLLIHITINHLPVTSRTIKHCRKLTIPHIHQMEDIQQPLAMRAPYLPKPDHSGLIFVANHILLPPRIPWSSISLIQSSTQREHMKTKRPKLASHLEWLILKFKRRVPMIRRLVSFKNYYLEYFPNSH